MKRYHAKLVAASVAVVALWCWQAEVEAGGIGFRNDTVKPVIVQGSSVVNAMVRRGRPLLIYSRRVGWDNKLAPGLRTITIYNAERPTQILFRKTIPFRGRDMFFSICIVETPKGPRLTIVQKPRW